MTNKIMTEFKNSDTKIIDEIILKQYIDFCLSEKTTRKKYKTSFHHILPVSIFGEFSNLKINEWNGVHLSHENHYKAHSLLANAIDSESMLHAWWCMSHTDKKQKNVDGNKVIGAKEYSKLFEKSARLISSKAKGMVTCKIKSTGEFAKIPKKEFDKNNELYEGVTKGQFTVIEISTGKRIMVTSEEYSKNESKYSFHLKGSSRSKESIEKEKVTKRIIGEDGLNINQRAGYRGHATLIDKLTEEEYEKVGKSKASHKENHPLALRINIYNEKDELMYECHGNIKDIIKENNLPCTLLESYRKDIKLGDTIKKRDGMIKSGKSAYMGWYAKKIK